MDTTRVYIDGFNLYHGIIQSNRLHWLDLEKFSERLNRGRPVDRVLYCTASVSSTPDDPEKAQRQDAYLRAVRIACPKVEIIKGNLTTNRKLRPIAGCLNRPPCAVKVSIREEKGSDVNLATRLIHDAHLGRFDLAIVVSGDSDLVEPIRLVTSEIKKPVWVRNPRDLSSAELEAVATDYARIRPAVLQATQLPDPVRGEGKEYFKPARWSRPLPAMTKKTILCVACPQAGCTKHVTTCRIE